MATFELALQTLYTALARYSVGIPISSPPKFVLPTIVTIYRDGIQFRVSGPATQHRTWGQAHSILTLGPGTLYLQSCRFRSYRVSGHVFCPEAGPPSPPVGGQVAG